MAMNNSLGKRPSWSTRSALLKNLNANPISTNPKTTFTLFNHPPLWGKLLSHPGNTAKRPNGNANAIEKPSMTAVGAANEPVAAPANADPTSGPVQEKDTMAKVAAMKKMPKMPPRSEAWSALFAQLAGSWISKAPKKLNPNTSSNANRNTLNKGSVLMTFNTSTPKKAVKARPSPV